MNVQNTRDPIAAIREHVEELSVSHAWWSDRENPSNQPGSARRAASRAVDSIDALLRELHQLRSQTITECRRWDDAVDARVDAYLAARRQRGEPDEYGEVETGPVTR